MSATIGRDEVWQGTGTRPFDSGRRRVVLPGGMTISAETRAESIGAPIFKERRTDRTVKLGFRDGSEMIVVCEVQSVWTDEKYLSRINGKDLMVVMAETVNREAEPEWSRLG